MDQIFIRDREVVTMEYFEAIVAELQRQINELKGTTE